MGMTNSFRPYLMTHNSDWARSSIEVDDRNIYARDRYFMITASKIHSDIISDTVIQVNHYQYFFRSAAITSSALILSPCAFEIALRSSLRRLSNFASDLSDLLSILLSRCVAIPNPETNIEPRNIISFREIESSVVVVPALVEKLRGKLFGGNLIARRT